MAKSDNELLRAVKQLSVQRNLPNRIIVAAIESAIAATYRRDVSAGGQEVGVSINPNTGNVEVFTAQRVVADGEIEDELAEITLSAAKVKDAHVKVGNLIKTGSLEYSPGRAAASVTRQAIAQRLRDAQQDTIFEEYINQENQLILGKIHKIERKYIEVDLGSAIAKMPPLEQSEAERYRPGQQMKFYVTKIRKTQYEPDIVVSRSHPDLLRRLIESEVPEIRSKIVEIKAISREAGSRSKVAVTSLEEGLDPVGACVGMRGIRIQNVVKELHGEKIDIVEWNSDITKLIENSLSPASVVKVDINNDTGTAYVNVLENEFSLAIGKEGQNVRLASKLVNFAIEIVQIKQEKQAVDIITSSTDTKDVESTVEVIKTPEESLETELEDSQLLAKSDTEIADEQDLLYLEEEIAELERIEKEEQDAELIQKNNKIAAPAVEQDVWNVDFLQSSSSTNNQDFLRFAEDIDSLKERSNSPRQPRKKKRTDRRKEH